MTEERTYFWNLAGAAGLVLAGVSIGFDVLNQLLPVSADSFTASILISVASLAILVAKLTCIAKVLIRFIRKYIAGREQADRSSVFRFSLTSCLLSSLVVSGAILLIITYVVPADFIEVLRQEMTEILTANAQMSADQITEALDQTLASLPSMMFWASMLRCMFWGLIFSLILRRRVFPDNPFNETEE